MLFHSYEFLFLFLPLTLLGFLFIERYGKHEQALGWLVAASLFFYGWWNYKYLALLLFSIGINYVFGAALSRRPRKALLWAGVCFNLILLGYYKYANFLVDTVNMVTGSDFHIGAILLPLAISFHTFQQIAYLVDAYHGRAREYNALHYVLFVAFFPQLIAGPIVHHNEMLPQFARGMMMRDKTKNLVLGLSILILGLFKKVVIADNLGRFADPVFAGAAAGNPLTFIEAWGAALSYTFQLYFDFSGYSDMAIGAARMFGIVLPLNFNSPYKATNIIDFWRRWHMTLSRFLRDFLYIPLGGGRRGAARRYVNLMIVMLLGGLWHGAGWNFVLWGGLHGAYLCVNHGFRALGLKIPALSGWALTFLAVVVAWVFFRATTLDSALAILYAMADIRHIIVPLEYEHLLAPVMPFLDKAGIVPGGTYYFYGKEQVFWIAAAFAASLLLPNVRDFFKGYSVALTDAPQNPARFTWAPTARWGAAFALLTAISLCFIVGGYNVFLYFQF